MEASFLPSACSLGSVCACASVCLAECAARVCREGGEHGVSHSTTLFQAPSAAPFYFALNGLSKDPLSRAAESFLHFKKEKKKMVGIILGQYLECEEMLSRGLWPEFISDTCKFALCSPSVGD